MIKVKNLTKSYYYRGERKLIFRRLNFDIKDGESVAILGRNGSGKSTLIRILSGCESYDKGSIETNKNISWPISLQGGFQSSLTGRENIIFVCKLYFGNDQDTVNSKIRFVKKFADIGTFFDRPLKVYSNGMRSRLAFGLSMSFDFDTYLIDEIAAVGDIAFKKKCELAIKKKLSKNSTFISVSNSSKRLDYVSKVFILINGDIIKFDNPEEGYQKYAKIYDVKIK
jgi:capsular polysaccharide transport system ATP-binding protein